MIQERNKLSGMIDAGMQGGAGAPNISDIIRQRNQMANTMQQGMGQAPAGPGVVNNTANFLRDRWSPPDPGGYDGSGINWQNRLNEYQPGPGRDFYSPGDRAILDDYNRRLTEYQQSPEYAEFGRLSGLVNEVNQRDQYNPSAHVMPDGRVVYDRANHYVSPEQRYNNAIEAGAITPEQMRFLQDAALKLQGLTRNPLAPPKPVRGPVFGQQPSQGSIAEMMARMFGARRDF